MLPGQASAHSVSLSWTLSTDDPAALTGGVEPSGSGYTVYRMSGACPATITSFSGFTALNSAIIVGTAYVDSTVTPGSYCYFATYTLSAASSGPSNTVGGAILPAAPTNVKVTSAN